MVTGNSQLNRYFTSPALAPTVDSGHTSTSRAWRFFSSKRATEPPTLPEPVPVDQMMLLSTGSGVAKPLSPPPIACHKLREICPRPRAPSSKLENCRLLLGPRHEGPSCRLP